MTKVTINPGVCGLVTKVKASSADQMEVKLEIASACPSINGMLKELGDTFDAYELCLVKPGEGPFYAYAAEHLPGHSSCPAIAGILKCVEAECRLALPKDASIMFETE